MNAELTGQKIVKVFENMNAFTYQPTVCAVDTEDVNRQTNRLKA
jgi:hypothetical protein